jgi:addiction module RelE/StbE family toxin
MRVFWAFAAEQDRTDIIDYIGQSNPFAAARMDELFAKTVGRLVEHPHLGKPGQIPGTRELIPHENYRVVYEVQGDAVWILALVHTARMWPTGSK